MSDCKLHNFGSYDMWSQCGSMIVRNHLGNLEIKAAHQGGIVHQDKVVIERADWHDLFVALREFLAYQMCLDCGGPLPCHCENDE